MLVVVEVDDGFQLAFALEVAQEVADFTLLVGEAVHLCGESKGCTVCYSAFEGFATGDQVTLSFVGCVEIVGGLLEELVPGVAIDVLGDGDVAVGANDSLGEP